MTRLLLHPVFLKIKKTYALSLTSVVISYICCYLLHLSLSLTSVVIYCYLLHLLLSLTTLVIFKNLCIVLCISCYLLRLSAIVTSGKANAILVVSSDIMLCRYLHQLTVCSLCIYSANKHTSNILTTQLNRN